MFKRCWWLFLVMALIGPVVGWAVTALATSTPLWLYESEAVVEVRPLSSEKASNSMDQDSSRSGDSQVTPGWLRSAAVDIKSDPLLGRVVDQLKLTNHWGVNREIAIETLKRDVETQNIRSTDLIAIRVRDKDNVDARDIAVEIAKVYKGEREEVERREQKKRLMELSPSIKNQEAKVELARKLMAQLESRGMENIIVDGAETLLHLPLSRQESDAKQNLDTDQELLAAMKLTEIAEVISSKMPHERVIVHIEPQIAESPVSFNVKLNLLLGAGLGFLLALFGALWLVQFRCGKEGGTSAHPDWPQSNPP